MDVMTTIFIAFSWAFYLDNRLSLSKSNLHDLYKCVQFLENDNAFNIILLHLTFLALQKHTFLLTLLNVSRTSQVTMAILPDQ